MRQTTVEDLICHRCVSISAAELPLSISALIPVLKRGEGETSEILEAILTCGVCRCEYPIVSGVLITVPDVSSYIKSQFSAIVSRCTLNGGISSDLLLYMCNKGYNLAKAECREYYDSTRKLSTYICNHYDDITQVVPKTNSFGQYLHEGYNNFYEYALNLLATSLPLLKERQRAIDVGCYVGGVVNRLASSFERLYGIDISFAGILLARQILVGYPTRVTEYDLYLDGNISLKRMLKTSLRENVDFLVASALSIPFRSTHFDLITNFNLLELVSDPGHMLQELLRISHKNTQILITSPYWWEDDEASTENWVGGRDRQSTPEAVRSLLKKLGVEVIAEEREVPWILRYNNRAFMSFVNDMLIGKVVG